jgi:hypothetical protein
LFYNEGTITAVANLMVSAAKLQISNCVRFTITGCAMACASRGVESARFYRASVTEYNCDLLRLVSIKMMPISIVISFDYLSRK